MFAENFGVANVEYMDGVAPLLVISIYNDKSGQLINNIIIPFEGYAQAIAKLAEANVYHVWTSDKGLYAVLLKSSSISAEFKHSTDTIDTANAVAAEKDVLKDIYGVAPVKSKRFAALRGFISDQLIKLAMAINY